LFGYRIHTWGADPVWGELPDPVPEPGELLVEVEACSVGLTVLNCINGDLDDDIALLPRVPGHEFVGRVAAVGPGVDASRVGRRVVAYFYLQCGECPACRAGQEPRCSQLSGWVGVNRDGGYAPMATLPSRNAIVVPDDLDPLDCTVIPDAVATPVHVAARAEIGPDDRVVVLGAGGGVGIHMIQVARHLGAEVAGFEVVDEKLAEIERLGAAAVQSEDLGAIDASGVFAGGPPTVVVDLVGTSSTGTWAVEGAAMGGRIVSLTTFRDRRVNIESRELVFRELSLIGSRYSNRTEVAEAARLVASGAVEPIIGEIRGPAEVLDIHDSLRGGSIVGRGALDWRLK
jgi:D-arabinose 1-dehydrogenase-like Zn-dependent alcohol dehydrogenase